MAEFLPVNPEDLQQTADVAGVTLPVVSGDTLKTVSVKTLAGEVKRQVKEDGIAADGVSYDNQYSGLSAGKVQGALDELALNANAGVRETPFRTVGFDGFVEGAVTVQQAGGVGDGKIVFSPYHKRFLLRTAGSKYYPAFAKDGKTQDDYCDPGTDRPHWNKVYIYSDRLYVWNGESLVMASGGGQSVTLDAAPTPGSHNAVESGGVHDALAAKQDKLTAGTGIKIQGNVISSTVSGGGGGSVSVIDDLHSTDAEAALSANMGGKLHAEDCAHGMVVFDGFITDNVTVQQTSTMGAGEVVYCVPHKTFLLRVVAGLSTKYYNNFTDRERFCALAGGAPYTGKVYLCGREPYIYHGGALVKMCVTDLYDLTGMLTVQALNDAGYDGQLWVLGVDLDVTGLQGTTKMFRNCANLRTVNLRRVYAVKNFSGWFAGCKSLTSVSIAEMRDAVNLSSMFENTSSLTGEIRLEGLQNCTNLNRVFINCAASAIILPELPAWTTGVATFDFTSKLATLELPNYGMNENTPAITFHRNAPLSKETIVNLLNGVHDRKGKGWSPLQINFSGKQFVGDAEVTAAIANATAKGFTIANLIV